MENEILPPLSRGSESSIVASACMASISENLRIIKYVVEGLQRVLEQYQYIKRTWF